MLGHVLDVDRAQLELLACRYVQYAVALRAGDFGMRPELSRGRLAARDADAHHELARRRLAVERADPLETLSRVGVDGLPAAVLGRDRLDFVEDGQAVALSLEFFD